MSIKLVLLVGAGATLSDALNISAKSRPPLDKGFFAGLKSSDSKELESIRNYMLDSYNINPFDETDNSLEGIMAILYSDIYSSEAKVRARRAFRDLLRLLNRRLAETTNSLKPTLRSNLYRILCRYMGKNIRLPIPVIPATHSDLKTDTCSARRRPLIPAKPDTPDRSVATLVSGN